MKIILEDIGKRFQREWIFKGINFEFQENQNYCITGSNGSGKSTLANIVSGYSTPTKGLVSWEENGKKITEEEWFKHFTWCAPYIDLYEHYTLKEAIQFHFQFKNPIINLDDFISIINLEKHKDKQVKDFSSGMKQRLKLALAIFSDCPVLLLDEPSSNLDFKTIEWYKKLLKENTSDKTVIVFSNDPDKDTLGDFLTLQIEDYKKHSL